MMKTLFYVANFILLFAFSILTNVNAQTNSSDPKTELLDLLQKKHDYERILDMKTAYERINSIKSKNYDIQPSKAKYQEAFAKIKKNKKQILSYINTSLKNDTTELSKKIILYQYEAPWSSYRDRKNRITLLAYFKIVKYSLETKKDTLPPLAEVTFK